MNVSVIGDHQKKLHMNDERGTEPRKTTSDSRGWQFSSNQMKITEL